ncbi:hypothetical protein VHUM_00447 [Vanrija humicola]|uniref:Uncharacterized protein n=1 Tax=Vanrija humicola TaxID=5417 RepID=A0A7D8Z807_VANHU|nr:hypothetical protein VHUM_00447 [Vanrija humicola]
MGGHVEISVQAIGDFLSSLPQAVVKSAPASHLPTALPLAFPSDLHHVNFLAVLHLVNAAFAGPQHLAYFAESRETPGDTALRGVLGMFLASEPGWTAGNLLSAKAWASGELGEAKVAEFFGIEILREREHETMKGVRVGERWKPAVDVAVELVELFKTLGDGIKASCLGEDVIALLTVDKERSVSDPDTALSFAKDFCHLVVGLVPTLADPYPAPPGTVLPAAPLELLQDLAHQFGPDNASIPLPAAKALANVSPLPLPIGVLLHLGILEPSESLEGAAELKKATGNWWSGRKPGDLFAPPKSSETRLPEIIKVPADSLSQLLTASVDACREIVSHAHFLKDGEEWKKALSEVDISHIFASLNTALDSHQAGIRLVLA